MNKKKIAAILLILAATAITIFIFSNSAKAAEDSRNQSAGIVEKAADLLEKAGLTVNTDDLSFYVRKFGHFSEYFLLSALISPAVALTFENKKLIALAPVYCFAVAVIDEFAVQASAAGRSPEWRDCFIDLGGALSAVLLTAVILYIIKRKKSNSGSP